MEIVDEADSVEDMQALARRQWFKRAKQLGMVQEAVEESSSEQEAIIRLGITGGEFPKPLPPEESAEESSKPREE
jgi:hypothetical protein